MLMKPQTKRLLYGKEITMPKRGLGINVLQAAKDRINYTFDNFERVYISFSAGKDSTLMLHLVMEEAIRLNLYQR